MLKRTSLIPLLFVQLLGTTDFMLVMPLGPSLAEGFHIPVENTAWLSGVFALCAAVSGIVFSKYLDAFARKPLLISLLLISAVLFFISALVESFSAWIILRGLIGCVSTPIAALSMAIAMDMSEQDRPKAMAFMSLGFSLSAVVGVPLGLWLASLTDWQMVYWIEGLLACCLCLVLFFKLSQTRSSHTKEDSTLTLVKAWQTPELRHGLVLMCVSLFAAFLIIPHLAAILQFNFDVPFTQLGSFYALGGVATMILTLLTGKLLTNKNGLPLLIVGSALSLLFLWAGFVFLWLAPVVMFVAFMSLNGSRNLIIQTHLSHLPKPHERAGYMAILTTIRNVSTALAAFISSRILVSNGTDPLLNVPALVAFGSVFIVMTPFLFAYNAQPDPLHEK